MGQYYAPTIIYPDGSSAFLNGHAYNNGIKLTEHSWISNHLVNAVYCKIRNKPRRIAWIGDYSDTDYETCGDAYTKQISKEEFLTYYHSAWAEDEDNNNFIPPSMYSAEDFELINEKTTGMHLVNHDRKEYLDLGEYIGRCTINGGNWAGWCVDPLPLLTACGNDRGGGDFYDSPTTVGYNDVGIWAFQELELTETIPESYRGCAYSFIE